MFQKLKSLKVIVTVAGSLCVHCEGVCSQQTGKLNCLVFAFLYEVYKQLFDKDWRVISSRSVSCGTQHSFLDCWLLLERIESIAAFRISIAA